MSSEVTCLIAVVTAELALFANPEAAWDKAARGVGATGREKGNAAKDALVSRISEGCFSR